MVSVDNRILTSHVGALPRPPGLPGVVPIAPDVPKVEAADATRDVVRKQHDTGIDIINDGEFGKTNFQQYVSDRLSGIIKRPVKEGEKHTGDAVAGRDMLMFPQFFAARGGAFPHRRPVIECKGPIRFIGHDAIAADIRNLSNSLKAVVGQQGFLTAISPNMIGLSARNAYYKDQEEFLVALADALHEEYVATTNAGFTLQIDDPGFAHAWQGHPEWSVDDCRRWCAKGVELLNYALRDCPPEQVRFHVCWGSYNGPHAVDLELKYLIDLLYRINVSCYSIEGGNARHEHEWQVFADAKLPDGKSIMPGVVSHATDTVEHPELVAQRLERYASVVGRERVVGGTDCGMMRVHPEICWAKLASLVEGARIASARLWR